MIDFKVDYGKSKRRKNYIEKLGIKIKNIPTTLRYCINCKKNYWFKYDRNVGHSNCSNCGQYRSGHPIANEFLEENLK